MISKSFLKSSLVFTIGGALPMLAGIILLPFYTNYLSALHYTQLLFYISVSLFFQVLFSFSIESYFGIKYTQLNASPEEQKRFIGTTSLLLLLIGALLLLVLALFGNGIFHLIWRKDFEMEFWPYGFFSLLTAFFNAYFKTSSVVLIYLKKPSQFLISNIVNFFATLIISIGGLYLYPDSIIGPMYGRLLSGVVIFLFGHFVFIKNGIFKLTRGFIKELMQFCAPYSFYAICIWILGQVDRYFLQSYISNIDLNAYDLMLKCFFGIEFLQNSLSAVIFPKLYELWSASKENTTTPETNRYSNVFTAINILQLIVFCIALPMVYQLIIHNETFYQSEKYIGLIAAGYALRSILNFYLSTILFTKNIGVLLKIFGVSAVFQLLITVTMIERFGLMGAIYASLATKILQISLCSFFTKGIFKFEFNYFKIIVIPFIYILINVLQYFFVPEYNAVLYFIQLFLFGTLFYFVYRNEIKKVWHNLLG